MIQNDIINNSELVNGILFIFSISYQHTKINLQKSSATKTALNTRCAACHKNNVLSPTTFYNKALLQ